MNSLCGFFVVYQWENNQIIDTYFLRGIVPFYLGFAASEIIKITWEIRKADEKRVADTELNSSMSYRLGKSGSIIIALILFVCLNIYVISESPKNFRQSQILSALAVFVAHFVVARLIESSRRIEES